MYLQIFHIYYTLTFITLERLVYSANGYYELQPTPRFMYLQIFHIYFKYITFSSTVYKQYIGVLHVKMILLS